MNSIARFFDIFRDSPTYGRDRDGLMSAGTIGVAGLLLNAAVLLLVSPLMLYPDDAGFRVIHENVEFGQTLALILLGGATMFATLLIPLRLATVFWGPRLGRYFDQVVLSGITPLRFVIGKVTSQNLFLGLILFLLLPYFALSFTLGGVDWGYFVAGLFLLWLYCMALALVTIWASLYLNELLAAILVIAGAGTLVVLGCIPPLPIQPFVMTPVPALMHPLYSKIPNLAGQITVSYTSVYLSTVLCLAAIIGTSLFAISLGPLFGIVRENSTFGEVVRRGDSKRNRWLRLRLHIQRPSEIAFFYENRGDTFRRSEGLIRWGIGLGGLTLLLAAAHLTCIYFVKTWSLSRGGSWWVFEFHAAYLTVHGGCLVLGVYVFSHALNSTYLRIPFFRGKQVEVSRLDTVCFVVLALISTAASIAVPFQFEQLYAMPNQTTVFPDLMYGTQGRPVDYRRIAIEGTLLLTLAGFVVYAMHRYLCLSNWVKSLAMISTTVLYWIFICLVPLMLAALYLDGPMRRSFPVMAEFAQRISTASPLVSLLVLFKELPRRFPEGVSTVPFYVLHLILFILLMAGIRRRGRKVRELYLEMPQRRLD